MAVTRHDPAEIDLRQYGIRVTPQRQAILRFLKETDTHPTAEQIYDHVRHAFPGISLATVYNTVNLFVELGLVRELVNADRSSRFDGDVTDHYHLVCNGCGAVRDIVVDLTDIELPTGTLEGFDVSSTDIVFRGRCATCTAGAGSGMPPTPPLSEETATHA